MICRILFTCRLFGLIGITLALILVIAPYGTSSVMGAPVRQGEPTTPADMEEAPLLTGVNAITAGQWHTCALTTSGGVKCWGDNDYGKLGDGTTTSRSTPVAVSGLSSGVQAIAAGRHHTCALTTSGGVKCWGRNDFRQLGDGTTNDRWTPVSVSGLSSGIQAIAVGGWHTCVLTTSGGVMCWGDNIHGQLGDGTETGSGMPVAVSGLSSGIKAITAGYFHSCALTTLGGVMCWGTPGDDMGPDELTPVTVSGLGSGVQAIAAGEFHSCALTTLGGVMCWGDNESGQLGDGTTTHRWTPVAVSSLSNGVQAIAAGGYHTCALTINGGVKCWGSNVDGEVGDGTTAIHLTPVAVSELSNGVQAVAAGGSHTCALTTTGGVMCWGAKSSGQLGDGTIVNPGTPVAVSGLSSDAQAVATGWSHVCALTITGSAKCLGRNYAGQLGDGTTTTRLTPVVVSGLSSGVQAITAGPHYTCALTTSGGIRCWGSNLSGQLGDGTTTDRWTPVAVSGLSNGVQAIAAGDNHTCALTTSGGAMCWGYNMLGRLGDGTTTDRLTPVVVSGLSSGVQAIAAGDVHTCALTTSGGVKCWGANFNGGLGDGTTIDRWAPVDVSGLSSGIRAVTVGGYHTCALTTSGGVMCWGLNGSGQIGDGTTTSRLTPVAVSNIGRPVQAITAGNGHTCALTTGGGVMCWGSNDFGQLGDGTTTDRLTPVAVSGLSSGIRAVTVGGYHTCALTTSGGAKCWGSTSFDDFALVPVDVIDSSYSIIPIYPTNHSEASIVMQGGAAYRHFRLIDLGGNPISNATVTFSVGDSVTSDGSGFFTAIIPTNALGGPGSYLVTIQSVAIGLQTYATNNQPVFGVEVTERRYSHAWSYGASTRAKGGVSAGLTAYLQRTTSGGLELKLEESNPDVASDDVVLMKVDFSEESGMGGGVGIEGGVSIVILQIKGGANATAEGLFRDIGSSQARFPDPYSDNDRKAGGLFLLASTIDSLLQAFPGKPFAVQFLKLAIDRGLPYRDYISEQQAGFGGKITPLQENVGASASLGIKRSGATWKERLLDYDLVDVGVTVVQMNQLTDYRERNEWGLGFESEYDLNWSLNSWQIGDFRNKFGALIGDRAKKVKVEFIFDSSTDAPKRLELSFTGEGNSLSFTDVAKEEVTLKLIIPSDQLGSDRLSRTVNILRLLLAAQGVNTDPLRIGPSAMVIELNNLLDGLDYVAYEVTADDGAETSWETELGITFGIKIELGPGLEIKKVRGLVRERGVFMTGKPFITESYSADALVSRPGKSWVDLSTNALGGLWLLVQDAFDWVWQQVTSGVSWGMHTVARTADGVIRGEAEIFAPSGTQLYAPSPDVQGAAIQQTAPITVTATGWFPGGTVGVGALAMQPKLATASGEGFVVGGIYAFQPYFLTLSPAASLIINYSDQAATRVDENCIGMFRWNPEGNNWQPMAAAADPTQNTIAAAITQLGTFALGCDVTPPEISILEPTHESTISNPRPLVSAIVVDSGVGIDPSSVTMRLDGQIAAANYITGTGELTYLPTAPLSSGQHNVEILARDVMGNQAGNTTTFTLNGGSRIYLPLVGRQ